jgi:type II secretory pathway component PulF
LFLLFVAYKLLARLRGRAALSRLWLRLPLVGPCAEALALGRFALALRLTLDSTLPIARALRLSLAATGNAAFESQAGAIAAELKSGRDLTSALVQAGIFPARFLEMAAVGEESGRLPEVMEHQFSYYQEEAERRLATLTRVGTALVWLVYVGFMVVAIFRLAGIYLRGLGV